MATTSNTLLTGIPVGRFEVVREVGRGGIAVVYLARQPGLQREVALKELSAVHAHDPAFAERFLREARIAGSLNHPNIVSVLDYFEIDGVPYIAMEYVPNGSLRIHMRSLDLAQIAGVLDGVLSALAFAGRRGVVHRDVKPENLLFGSDGIVKVADFGVAKALYSASDTNATVTGMTVGTPAYMAPEQAVGKNVGAPADVYAVGVIAYELLTGRTPFDDAETPVAMLYRHVHDTPEPPSARRPDVHPQLESWVLSLLAKLPEERPTAEEARDQLEEIALGEIGPRWRRDGVVGALPPSGEHVAIDASPPQIAAVGPPPGDPADGNHAEDDGFRTFAPRLRRRRAVSAETASVPAATPSAAQDGASGATQPAPVDPPREDVAEPTSPAMRAVATTGVVPGTEPASRPATRRRPSRRTLVFATALAGAASVTGAIALVAGSEGGTSTPESPLDIAPLTRPDMAVNGGAVFIADPKGRVLRLGLPAFAVAADAREPLSPRSLTVTRQGVLVADSRTITRRDPDTLAPAWSVATGGPAMLDATSVGPLAAVADGSENGRLCAVTSTGALSPCAVLGFSPGGIGHAGTTVLVADPAGSQLVTFDVTATTITRNGAIAVGARPGGRIVGAADGTAVVGVERGVVTVDLATRRVVATTPLPTTPADVAIAGATGRVVVALPASDRVGIIDPGAGTGTLRVVDTGSRPLAVGTDSAGARAFAVGADGSVGAIDLSTGTLDRKAPLPEITTVPGTASVTAVTSRTSGRVLRVTLTLDRPLDRRSLVTSLSRIPGGSGALALWQGGIRSEMPRATAGDLRLSFRPLPGRLAIRIAAPEGRYESAQATLTRNRESVVLTFTRPRPRPVVRQPEPVTVTPAQPSVRRSAPPRGGGGGGGGPVVPE